MLPIYSGLLVSLVFVFLVFKFKNFSQNSATINLASSLLLSISIILLSINSVTVSINQLLFGDIMSISHDDIVILICIFLATVCFIWIFLNKIILIVVHRDIAIIQGINVGVIELMFLILLGVSVFSAIKIVGTLLVTSILLLPAMGARVLAKNPMQMIMISPLIALVSNSIALIISFCIDLPIAPTLCITGIIVYTILIAWKPNYK